MALAGQLLVRRAETSRTNRELKSAGGGFPVFPTPCIVASLAPGIGVSAINHLLRSIPRNREQRMECRFFIRTATMHVFFNVDWSSFVRRQDSAAFWRYSPTWLMFWSTGRSPIKLCPRCRLTAYSERPSGRNIRCAHHAGCGRSGPSSRTSKSRRGRRCFLRGVDRTSSRSANEIDSYCGNRSARSLDTRLSFWNEFW
jgi:hypothetical protein